jgi:hypothetical protein
VGVVAAPEVELVWELLPPEEEPPEEDEDEPEELPEVFFVVEDIPPELL